ncbi:phospholipase D-like domain-containing protein [Alteribacter keqinensis]|nr:phospholipase D-like domain-containing protein [Alteribacter keqinensis]
MNGINVKVKIILLVFLLLTPTFTTSSFSSVAAEADNIIITEVYYDTHMSFEPDEYVAITNPLSNNVDISGWQIGDDGTKAVFPQGTIMEGGETFYIVREANIIIEQNILSGITPQFEFSENTDPSVPNMAGANPRFANGGDEVFLKDGSGEIIDVVVYGSSDYEEIGWTGDPAARGSSGDVLRRNQVERTGAWIDTDSRSDWDSLKGNPLAETADLRTYKQAQSDLDLETFDVEGIVRPYTSPDSTFSVLEDLFSNAQHSIELSVYEMHSPYLTEILVDAIERGVEVRAHFDGGPVGGLQDDSRWVSQQLHDAGGEVRYIVMGRDNDQHKRYRWDHSKYGIIDDEIVFVQSENFKKTGTPVDNSSGNRGYGVVIEDADVAGYFQDVFEEDWDDLYPDVFAHDPSHERYGNPPAGFEPDYDVPTGSYPSPFESKAITGDFKITPVIAPDTSFKQEDSILGMIKDAEDYVYVSQMYSHKFWGGLEDSSDSHPNIYMEAVIDAARAGATVRVSLGDAWLDPDNPRDNTRTIEYLHTIAEQEGIDIEAQLIDTEAIGLAILHNKGVIADDRVLVSSINWSKNSGKNNREAGVIIENQDVADFYKEVFEYDWAGGDQVIGVAYEDFESGVKETYSADEVTLSSGAWLFDNALLGTLSNDKKLGSQSARVRADGMIEMQEDIEGVASLSFYHGLYGSDEGGTITVQKSVDHGSSWTNVTTLPSQRSLEKERIDVNESENVRLRFIVSGEEGTRVNIDHISYVEGGITEPVLAEGYEGAAKGSYAAADVELSSGLWHLDNALIGTHQSDKKIDDRSLRIRANGHASMEFDVPGAHAVSFYHANFGSDTGAEILLQQSTDQGETWNDAGEAIISNSELERHRVVVDTEADVRFRIVADGLEGSRVNIDEFWIEE